MPITPLPTTLNLLIPTLILAIGCGERASETTYQQTPNGIIATTRNCVADHPFANCLNMYQSNPSTFVNQYPQDNVHYYQPQHVNYIPWSYQHPYWQYSYAYQYWRVNPYQYNYQYAYQWEYHYRPY